MKSKAIFVIIILCVTIFLFTGCGQAKKPTEQVITEPTIQPEIDTQEPVVTEEPTPEPTATPADGYGVLGGTWKVGGIYYGNTLIDISQYPEIASIYDAEYLIFNQDGTFLYTNLFFSSGIYERLSGNSFVLKTERVYMMDYQDGQVVEKDMENSPKTSWIVTIVNGEMPGLRFAAMDPMTGKEKLDADPIIFVKASD